MAIERRAHRPPARNGRFLAQGGVSHLPQLAPTVSCAQLVFHIFGALAEFERSIIRERTLAELASARARGRMGGRPPALSEKDIAAAKAMLADPNLSVEQVARKLKVAPSTLYKHLPGGRSAVTG